MDDVRNRPSSDGRRRLAARKLEQWDGRPSPALESTVAGPGTMARDHVKDLTLARQGCLLDS